MLLEQRRSVQGQAVQPERGARAKRDAQDRCRASLGCLHKQLFVAMQLCGSAK
jgi:hypothetical protein